MAHRLWIRTAALAALALPSGACANQETASESNDVRVDTSNETARRQYALDVDFARTYRARCSAPKGHRQRVLIAGYGRFSDAQTNTSGLLVSKVAPAATYPVTPTPAPGEVDLPGPQTSVGMSVVRLEELGNVEICGMVLPVAWDLAAALVLKEMDAFEPDFVIMDGVATGSQELWLELGAVNRATQLPDGSENLSPFMEDAPLIPTAAPADETRGNLASWARLTDAANAAIASETLKTAQTDPWDRVMRGAYLAGYPRASNTYLCNNITYTVGYLMDHPSVSVHLLEADPATPSYVDVRLRHDFRNVPRLFIHWPELATDSRLNSGASVMKAIIAAQLRALRAHEPLVRGASSMATIALD